MIKRKPRIKSRNSKHKFTGRGRYSPINPTTKFANMFMPIQMVGDND